MKSVSSAEHPVGVQCMLVGLMDNEQMDGWEERRGGKREGGKEGRKTDEWMDRRKSGDALRCSRSALVSNMKLHLGQSPGSGRETRVSARGAGPGWGAAAPSTGRAGRWPRRK